MMNMWTTSGMTGVGPSMFWLHLHWFFGAFAIVGFVLLIAWALKNLAQEKLKSVTTWLLVIGIIGTLITAPFAVSGLRMMSSWRGGYGMKHMTNTSNMQEMMQMMMTHDEESSHEDHKGMEEMMQQMMQDTWHDQSGNVRGGMMMNQ